MHRSPDKQFESGGHDVRHTPDFASHELPAGHCLPPLQSMRHWQDDASGSFLYPTGQEPSGLHAIGSVILFSSHLTVLQNFVPSFRWHSKYPRALQFGGGVVHRFAVAHFGHSVQSSVSEHIKEALQIPIEGPPSSGIIGQGLSQKRVPSDFWQENKFRAAQSSILTGGRSQRGADVQSVSQSLQSSIGSQDFFSVQTVIIGGLHVFSAMSHTSGGAHAESLSHTGWHLPSALHLEPPGHSPLGPHVISVQEAVQ